MSSHYYIHPNENKTVFVLIDNSTFAYLPRKALHQLVRSQTTVVLTKINIRKEKNFVRLGLTK